MLSRERTTIGLTVEFTLSEVAKDFAVPIIVASGKCVENHHSTLGYPLNSFENLVYFEISKSKKRNFQALKFRADSARPVEKSGQH